MMLLLFAFLNFFFFIFNVLLFAVDPAGNPQNGATAVLNLLVGMMCLDARRI